MEPVTSSTQISAEYSAKLISMQKNVMKEQGDQAVKLIQAAAVLPEDQGHNLDVRA